MCRIGLVRIISFHGFICFIHIFTSSSSFILLQQKHVSYLNSSSCVSTRFLSNSVVLSPQSKKLFCFFSLLSSIKKCGLCQKMRTTNYIGAGFIYFHVSIVSVMPWWCVFISGKFDFLYSSVVAACNWHWNLFFLQYIGYRKTCEKID